MTHEEAWKKVSRVMEIFDEEGDGSTDALNELLLSVQDIEEI